MSIVLSLFAISVYQGYTTLTLNLNQGTVDKQSSFQMVMTNLGAISGACQIDLKMRSPYDCSCFLPVPYLQQSIYQTTSIQTTYFTKVSGVCTIDTVKVTSNNCNVKMNVQYSLILLQRIGYPLEVDVKISASAYLFNGQATYQVRPVTLTAFTLSTTSQVAQKTNTLRVTFTPKSKYMFMDYFVLTFPKLNYQDTSLFILPMFDSSKLQCRGIQVNNNIFILIITQGIEDNPLCTLSNTDITIQGYQTMENLSLMQVIFEIDGFINPYHLNVANGINFKVENSNYLINTILNQQIQITQPSQSLVSLLQQQMLIPGLATSINLYLTSTYFFAMGIQITISIPNELQFQGIVITLLTLISSFNHPGFQVSTTTNTLTITNGVLNYKYLTTIALKIDGFVNPQYVTSNDWGLQINLFDSSNILVEQSTTIFWTTQQQMISNIVIEPSSFIVRATTSYLFSFTTLSILDQAEIQITIPSPLILLDQTNILITEAISLVQDSTFSSLDNDIFIQYLDKNVSAPEQIISFRIGSFINPRYATSLRSFNIQTMILNKIQDYGEYQSYITFLPGIILIESATFDTTFTNDDTELVFGISFQNGLDVTEMIRINFDVDDFRWEQLQPICFINNVESQCSEVLDGQLNIYPTNILNDSNQQIRISQIRSPFSTKQISLMIETKNILSQELLDQSQLFIFEVLQPSEFFNVQVSQTQNSLKQNTVFTILLEVENKLKIQDTIVIKLPQNIIPSNSVQCSYHQQIFSQCSYSSLLSQLSISLLTELIPETQYQIIINGLKNPQYPQIELPFLIEAYSKDNYLIYSSEVIVQAVYLPAQIMQIRVSSETNLISTLNRLSFSFHNIITILEGSTIQIEFTTYLASNLTCSSLNGMVLSENMEYSVSQNDNLVKVQLKNSPELQPREIFVVFDDVQNYYLPEVVYIQFFISIFAPNSLLHQYGVLNSRVSFACSNEFCQRCEDNADICVQCYKFHYLMESQCVQTCPIGFIIDSNICVQCNVQATCIQCSDDDVKYCIECEMGYDQIEGVCIIKPVTVTSGAESFPQYSEESLIIVYSEESVLSTIAPIELEEYSLEFEEITSSSEEIVISQVESFGSEEAVAEILTEETSTGSGISSTESDQSIISEGAQPNSMESLIGIEIEQIQSGSIGELDNQSAISQSTSSETSGEDQSIDLINTSEVQSAIDSSSFEVLSSITQISEASVSIQGSLTDSSDDSYNPPHNSIQSLSQIETQQTNYTPASSQIDQNISQENLRSSKAQQSNRSEKDNQQASQKENAPIINKQFDCKYYIVATVGLILCLIVFRKVIDKNVLIVKSLLGISSIFDQIFLVISLVLFLLQQLTTYFYYMVFFLVIHIFSMIHCQMILSETLTLDKEYQFLVKSSSVAKIFNFSVFFYNWKSLFLFQSKLFHNQVFNLTSSDYNEKNLDSRLLSLLKIDIFICKTFIFYVLIGYFIDEQEHFQQYQLEYLIYNFLTTVSDILTLWNLKNQRLRKETMVNPLTPDINEQVQQDELRSINQGIMRENINPFTMVSPQQSQQHENIEGSNDITDKKE